MAPRVRAIVAARREAITWRRIQEFDTPQAYWSYLRRYPRGAHCDDARRRLAYLSAALEPPPSFAVVEYDVPPPPPEEIIYVERPVLVFDDPEFDFAPPPPPPIELPAAAASLFRRSAAAATAADRVRAAGSGVPAGAGLGGPAAGISCAAEQHHLQQHSQSGSHQQHDQHRHDHQSARSKSDNHARCRGSRRTAAPAPMAAHLWVRRRPRR